MTVVLNGMIFIGLLTGFTALTAWLWEEGVQEIVIYTENFLLEESKKLRVRVIPDVTGTGAWNRLELKLYYSGIRNHFPFVSGKVWLIFCGMAAGSLFLVVSFLSRSVLQALLVSAAFWVFLGQLLQIMRRSNLRNTERYLLELLNVTESFAATGEEPVAILGYCSRYMQGPIRSVLQKIELQVERGWSSGMILEQLKVSLEHPKWQEFIHNLMVCSMYNSDFHSVFQSSRKSIQSYLSSKKERQSIKHTAEMEMAAIAGLSFLIIWIMSGFLSVTVSELMWGNTISKGCTIYMLAIIALFFRKINVYEKE